MIKHKIRNWLISGVYYLGLTRLYKHHARRDGSLVRVLCFHDVPDRAWFASLLDILVAEYTVLTPEQFEESEFDNNRINILITFDDGYKSWVEVALPELEKRNLKVLFFINSGLLDAEARGSETVSKFVRNRLLLKTARNILSWAGAQRLKAAGHTIGSHTTNHVRMSTVSLEEAKAELQADKTKLESELSTVIYNFAYPFGTKRDYTGEAVTLVGQFGFNQQFSAVSGFVTVSNYKKLIPRMLVEDNLSPKSLKMWISGAYDIVRILY